jgi:hypothetical protein
MHDFKIYEASLGHETFYFTIKIFSPSAGTSVRCWKGKAEKNFLLSNGARKNNLMS